jgi:hypothetical protein
MMLGRLLEARMGKQGKREFVQVLRLMEAFSAVYGPVFIAPSEKRPRLITSVPACSLSTKVQSFKAAKALGLYVSPTLVARTDEVSE